MRQKVEHTKAHLTKLKRNLSINKLQSELNIKIMEITEEQIKEAHNAACSQWKQKIEQWFPECFKQNLEAGKWYKDTSNGIFMFCFSGKYASYSSESNNYGINAVGIWSEGLAIHEDIKYTPATTEEVESMLIKEAEKKGLIEGVKINKLDNYYYGVLNTMIIGKPKLELYGDILVTQSTNGYNTALMKDGKWATIVETPKEMTLEEIEKQLGHKVKIVS